MFNPSFPLSRILFILWKEIYSPPFPNAYLFSASFYLTAKRLGLLSHISISPWGADYDFVGEGGEWPAFKGGQQTPSRSQIKHTYNTTPRLVGHPITTQNITSLAFLFQCKKDENFRKHMLLLWQNNVPVSIEVLLCSDCRLGAQKARSVEFSTIPEPGSILIEQWTVSVQNTK